MHQLDPERPRAHDLARLEPFDRRAQLVLLELGLRHRHRQPPPVDHRRSLAELAQHPRQAAEMILMTVRDHDRLDRVAPLDQIAEIRQHKIDAMHLSSREAHPAIDHHDPPLVLHDAHVLADLAKTAQRQDAKE